MITTCIPFLVALISAWALTPLARRVAYRLNVVDRPDGGRKLQKKPVPLLGGVAVYISILLGFTAAVAMAPANDHRTFDLAVLMAIAGGLMCCFGVLDDRFHLRPRTKVLLQIVATIPVVAAGHYLEYVMFAGTRMDLGWLGLPLTIFWLITCMNAINLLDGMDGLASALIISSTAILAGLAATCGAPHVMVISLVIAGATMGFLTYNWPPASIYLGDSGSMVLGLSIGILVIAGPLRLSAVPSVAIPLAIMAIPLWDTSLAIVRRHLSGAKVSVGDRKHIHHCLLDRGLSVRQSLGILAALCLTTGSGALAASWVGNDMVALLPTFCAVMILARVGHVGVYEVSLLRLKVARKCLAAGYWLLGPSQTAALVYDAKGAKLVAVGEQDSLATTDVPTDADGRWTLRAHFEGAPEQTCELYVKGYGPREAGPQLLLHAVRELEMRGDAAAVGPGAILPFPSATGDSKRRAA